ncbi:MAG: hypothetical protein V4727_01440 [Verrucomicrobiota bacterium]
MSPLLPALLPDQLYPANAAYMGRTNLFETRMLGYHELQLDIATSVLMGIINGRAAIRHEAAAGPEILDLFSRAGIKVDEEIHLYQTEAEARACADRLAKTGHQFFWPYPLPAGYYPESAHLVSPDLYRRLNAKQNIAQLVSQEHLANQQVMSHEMLAAYEPTSAICLKAAGDAATGFGYAVFPCLDRAAFVKARAWFQERQNDIPAILIEEWIDVDRCWCVGLAISETQTICYGGAEQMFSTPGKQSGSIVDSNFSFPDEGASLAVKVGEAARKLGFRGIAGLDIGRSADGRFILFDPNFRIASSSSQLLFHPAASLRSGLAVSQSFQVTPVGDFKHVAQKLHGPIDEGWFMPTRFFNVAKHTLSNGKHMVSGFVMGADREAASHAWKKLQEMLIS